MKHGTMNSKDKNSLITAIALITMIILAVVFFTMSRMLPMIYMLIGVEAIEILYVIPTICEKYYKLYGVDLGASKWIPGYNMLTIFSKPLAIVTVVASVITLIIAFFTFAPLFWTNMSNLDTFADIQYRAFGWFIVALIILSIVVGIGFAQVLHKVNDMKLEFTHGVSSKAEFTNYALLQLPLIRCYALFNILNSINSLLNAGYEFGKDYTETSFTEDLTDED